MAFERQPDRLVGSVKRCKNMSQARWQVGDLLQWRGRTPLKYLALRGIDPCAGYVQVERQNFFPYGSYALQEKAVEAGAEWAHVQADNALLLRLSTDLTNVTQERTYLAMTLKTIMLRWPRRWSGARTVQGIWEQPT
jgi:hypothetical protein